MNYVGLIIPDFYFVLSHGCDQSLVLVPPFHLEFKIGAKWVVCYLFKF